jgi:hypothetical protein
MSDQTRIEVLEKIAALLLRALWDTQPGNARSPMNELTGKEEAALRAWLDRRDYRKLLRLE